MRHSILTPRQPEAPRVRVLAWRRCRACGTRTEHVAEPLAVWTRGGVQVSPIGDYGRSPEGRRLTRHKSTAEMLAEGCRLEGTFSKRRFVRFL